MPENTLYYGDNLDILRRYVKDESVDLVYLDPPFNSNASYNVLFAEKGGAKSAAQIKAFEDTWSWDLKAEAAYKAVVEGGGRVSQVMQAFRTFLGESDMLAYLAMMAPRLVALRRSLKPTGSIYLHCDPTASHYLKMLMDAVFGPTNFRNELIWKRHSARSVRQMIWPRLHDVILFYVKSQDAVFHQTRLASGRTSDPHDLVRGPQGLLYRSRDLTGEGTRGGETGRPWRGIDPTPKNRHWRVGHAALDGIDAEGRIHWQRGGMPRERDAEPYVPTDRTVVVGDVWMDIELNSGAQERLGYPTQKPEALLERIIRASSNEGDTVLDPFCGCGTAIHAAQRLNRAWLGIDVTQLAIGLIKKRLADAFGAAAKYEVIGEPVSVEEAAQLAADDKYQFQWWALGLVGARPEQHDQKKGADKGIDGRLYFHDDASGDTKQVIFSVKGGQLKSDDVRALGQVVSTQKAQIGVLISLATPTKPMRSDAAAAGFYDSPGFNKSYPRVQLLTIAELMAGKRVEMPPSNATFKKAPKAKVTGPRNEVLEFE